MNIHSRSKYIWLGAVGLSVLVILVASLFGSASAMPVVALALLVIYLPTAYLLIRGSSSPSVHHEVEAQPQPSRMTASAHHAVRRARHRPETVDTYHVLTDIGLLINERYQDGHLARRIAHSISVEDGAVQPYIKLRVPPDSSGMTAQIEFEFYDRAGKLQFSHRMEEYLRSGENLVVCDRQLPLRGNTARGRIGTWDLRVKVDGTTVAVHEFNMAGPYSEWTA